jgi:hypothetical protein
MATRKTPAPSNTPGLIAGAAALEAINTEVQALWQYVQVPLSAVAGTANDITANCDVALDTNKKGQKFSLTPVVANTGAATLSINTKPQLALKNRDGSVLQANRLAIGRTEIVENDGVAFRLMNDAPAAVGGSYRSIFAYQLANGTASQNHAAGWIKLPLNTLIINEIPGLTFDGALNQVTLSARTYEFDAEHLMSNALGTLGLYNVTDTVMVASQVRRSSVGYSSPWRCAGKFTLVAPKVFELRPYIINGSGGGNYGGPLSTLAPALPEQYGFLDLRSSS